MKKDAEDIIIGMGTSAENFSNSFFAEEELPQKEKRREEKTVTPSKPKLPKAPTPPQGSEPARKTQLSGSIRIQKADKAYIDRAVLSYRIATGKQISLSEFLCLCVRRALPRVSKEASDLLKTIMGPTEED